MREPIYYSINEKAARSARYMWSFTEYTDGSETESYKKQVDEAYLLAEQVEKEKPEQAEKAYGFAARFAQKYAEHVNKGFQIELMCPSVMICGASNFPVRKKEKQNARRDKHMVEYNYLMGIKNKIKSLVYSSEIIKSNDENAIALLQEKIFALTEKLENGKAMNKHYRKFGTMKGFEGLDEQKAVEFDKAISNTWYKCPAPPFELTNTRNKIKSAEGRIKEIQRLKEKAEIGQNELVSEYKNSICEVAENTENMRIQLFFNDKPGIEIRNILKSNGFRWSPREGAWQRQLTDNGKYATKKVINQLEKAVGENQ